MDQQHDDNKYTCGMAGFVANLRFEDIPADVRQENGACRRMGRSNAHDFAGCIAELPAQR